jgi:glutaconyl-CoA/methylmalonyl-CoA decarboxylase subunit delta
MNVIDMSLIQEGIGMSVVGMFVVFMALLFLWFSLAFITRLLNITARGWTSKKSNNTGTTLKTTDITGETSAAISLALHLYLEEMHDEDNTILTIRNYSKNYKPWSSKIYSVMGLNRRFHRKAS